MRRRFHNDPDNRDFAEEQDAGNIQFLAKAENSLLAVESNEPLAVGCVTGTGEITLNYLSSDARFRGIIVDSAGAKRKKQWQRELHPRRHRYRSPVFGFGVILSLKRPPPILERAEVI
jgi:hypothetical protein